LREHVTKNAESKCRGQAVPSARVNGPFRVDRRRREGGREGPAGGWGWGGGGWPSSVEVEEADERRKGGRRKEYCTKLVQTYAFNSIRIDRSG